MIHTRTLGDCVARVMSHLYLCAPLARLGVAAPRSSSNNNSRVLVCVEQGGVRALWSSVAFQDCKAYRLIRRAGIRIDELEGYVRKLHKKLLERCNELTNTVEQILRTSLDLLEELKWSSLMALSDDEQAEALMVLSTRAQRPTSTTL